MFSQVKLTKKLIALFAVVIAVFCTIQAPAFAKVNIDMRCNDRASYIELQASDSEGAVWTNTCGREVEFIVDFADGEWNYGSGYPYNIMVGPEGNPQGDVFGYFDNPYCQGAELSYVIDDQPVPAGCYSYDRSVFLMPGETITLINNDQKGSAHNDNSGSVFLYVHNFL
ncbi:hypothetical protein [Okeania sp. SIO2B3]|uniref:hypothetical protein n=1 Tax=Okeania sp. SIO2B3 TaxID=2607784 RepID=UPI0013C0287A|nr:hypothetical protein [Okeania sp. SIO2B3]NET42488.1 hypothetical protein [Okeania sp. SIO2B3]